MELEDDNRSGLIGSGMLLVLVVVFAFAFVLHALLLLIVFRTDSIFLSVVDLTFSYYTRERERERATTIDKTTHSQTPFQHILTTPSRSGANN